MIDSFRGEYRFLSNFYPAAVELYGETYPTVEHAYQAAKTNDPAARERIRWAQRPGDAKRLGQSVQIRSDWESVKVDVMRGLLVKKFSDRRLADMLLKTGDEELVEGNYWGDRFWGVCGGDGDNWLGRLLMEVRRELRGK